MNIQEYNSKTGQYDNFKKQGVGLEAHGTS